MSTIETSSSSRHRLKLGLAAIGLIAIGATAGGAIGHAFQPPIEMAPTHIVAIRNLAASDGIVTIKGRVAESFGSRFVVDDGSGRTLIDAGPHAGEEARVPLDTVVSVQGRFDRGGFRPSFLVGPSGTVTPLGPPPGHGHGHGRGGPGGGEGDGPGFAPPPLAPPVRG
jgi:hypothetical protein